MSVFLLVLFFILGTIIGSFLNVVIYRLHTGKSLSGRSHCLSCGTQLQWFELFPLFSYVVLRAKCRTCTAYIPPRYITVELLTGLSFVLLWAGFSATPLLLTLYLILTSILIVIAVYDLRHTIIPDELSLGVCGVALILLIYQVGEVGNYEFIIPDLLAGVGAGLFIGALWYISKGKWMGLGDAKLALPLGIVAGFPAVFSMVVISFWIGAVIAIVLMMTQMIIKRGKTGLQYHGTPITMKSEVPFAPFLIAGFVCVHFFHANIFDITFMLFLWSF